MSDIPESNPIVPLANDITEQPAEVQQPIQPQAASVEPHPLPATVQASLELDRRKNNVIPTPHNSMPLQPQAPKKKLEIGNIFKSYFNKKGIRLLLIPFGIVLGLCLLILCLTLTNIDTQVI